jgi:ABC-2 type transport system ATP-binding protein
LGETHSAIECRGVSRYFGPRAAVSDLSFTVPVGTVFGFLGPNGAGKTTTVRLMVGMLRPSVGTIEVLGQDPIRDGEAVRARCGVMLDQVGLYERLSAEQNLEFASRVARLAPAERRRRVDAALARVGLSDRRRDRVSGFSRGMRQKLGLARALLAEPELLILDEPTAGLDPASIVMVRDLLVSLAEESLSVFLCTHLLAEAQRICSRVAIIQDGRLIAVGAPDQIGQQGIPTARIKLSGFGPEAAGRMALPAGTTLSPIGGGEWRATMADPSDIEAIVAALVSAQVGVRAVIPEHTSLEESYLQLVGGDPHA